MPENDVITPAQELPADEMEVAYVALRSKVSNMVTLNLPGDEALRLLQPDFDALANVVRSKFIAPVTKPSDTLSAGDVAGIVKSTLAELLPAIVQASVAEVTKSIVKPAPVAGSEERVSVPRSIQPKVDLSTVAPAPAAKPGSIAAIARRSVGLPS